VHGDVQVGLLMPELFDDQAAARDEVDDSQRMQLRETRLSLAESDARRAQLIEEALKRITRGEFGRCLDCDGPIGAGRLRLVPWAARCRDCQEAVEREVRAHAPKL
jgi:DnaK suppressor protein